MEYDCIVNQFLNERKGHQGLDKLTGDTAIADFNPQLHADWTTPTFNVDCISLGDDVFQKQEQGEELFNKDIHQHEFNDQSNPSPLEQPASGFSDPSDSSLPYSSGCDILRPRPSPSSPPYPRHPLPSLPETLEKSTRWSSPTR
ncbi:hypothetical protein M427DRAFT_435462 [Gonapodya prolifera JEL478]|uniref:Uncharacterized protein n=1 Tax=Gonapodya prolifera (strain JEL478) TaxID=1344416 RepID=A0A139A407_GONPJ|nr:hypothetical protein M427DRAFT_435462 [Gonapodya prolifera JEL478]|eukprot:KXS11557.1 hypothetical protein M427DRAFT_435462 [Gonapodya prolifera JEL478]